MAKQRISLTLDSDVLERVDAVLEQKGVTNRSQGIEELLKAHLKREAVHDAVILAGGDDPNCLISINGRPVINHIIEHLADSGVQRVHVTTSDRTVEDTIVAPDGIDVTVILEDEPRGTAGALRPLREDINDTVLVMNGDILAEVDIADMKSAHREAGGLATIALTTVGDSSEYGVIRMKGNRIVGFTEKPEESFSKLINAGIYLLEPELLERIPATGTVGLEDFFEQLADEGQLNGYVYDGNWHEVGE